MERIIILAMFAQVTLSLVVMIIMGKRRITAAKNKQLNLTDFKTMQLDKAGDTVRVADRNFSNQFEIKWHGSWISGRKVQVSSQGNSSWSD